MRLTEFWSRMRGQFGDRYAESVARDQVLTSLDGRTAVEAIDAGVEPKVVWRAVCAAYEVPVGQRH